MNVVQTQSDVSSVRRGVGIALGLLTWGVVMLVVEFFNSAEEHQYIAATLAGLLFVLTGLQLWQCRHELNRLWKLLEESKRN